MKILDIPFINFDELDEIVDEFIEERFEDELFSEYVERIIDEEDEGFTYD